jgi:hypothetical protein
MALHEPVHPPFFDGQPGVRPGWLSFALDPRSHARWWREEGQLSSPASSGAAMSSSVSLTMGLGLGLALAGGVALGLAVTVARQRRSARRLDAAAALLYGRLQTSNDSLHGLREQIIELGPALIDAQRRWGFDLNCWPQVRELVGDPSPSAVSWWLLQHAPGIGLLRDGGRATDRFFQPAEFQGWRPPRIAERAG